MKPTYTELMLQNITWIIHEGEHYFVVNEIRQKYADLKFPPDKMVKLPVGGFMVNVIKAEDIEEMTEFDKNVVKFMKHKK